MMHVKELTMRIQAIAIYEQGILRLLTPVTLPEQARVRVQIVEEQDTEDDLHRAETVLIATGLVKPLNPPPGLKTISRIRRAELAHLYAVGGPLSEVIIAERDTR